MIAEAVRWFLRATGWVPAEEAERHAEMERQLRALSNDEAQLDEWRRMAVIAASIGITSAKEFANALSRGARESHVEAASIMSQAASASELKFLCACGATFWGDGAGCFGYRSLSKEP